MTFQSKLKFHIVLSATKNENPYPLVGENHGIRKNTTWFVSGSKTAYLLDKSIALELSNGIQNMV